MHGRGLTNLIDVWWWCEWFWVQQIPQKYYGKMKH